MPPDDRARLPYRPCVGILLFDPRGRIFVGRRIDLPGAWQMPQGGIDPGEEPPAAALRELREETGTARAELVAATRGWLRYDLPDHLIGVAWGGRWRGQEQKWFAARFLGTDTDIDIATPHPEFDAWRWAEPKEILPMAPPFKRRVYAAVLEELAPVFGTAT